MESTALNRMFAATLLRSNDCSCAVRGGDDPLHLNACHMLRHVCGPSSKAVLVRPCSCLPMVVADRARLT
jgi:hypothetical protein